MTSLPQIPGAYFLATAQKTDGPFTAEQIESMKASGAIKAYSWIFKQGDANWTPIGEAPALPPLPGQTGVSAQAVQAPASAPKAALRPQPTTSAPFQDTRVRTTAADAFRVILFDSRNAITAWLSVASGQGCEILADLEDADPLFVEKSGALLNLHELATGKTSQVRVEIDRVFRREKNWVYRVRWTAVPAIFAESRAS